MKTTSAELQDLLYNQNARIAAECLTVYAPSGTYRWTSAPWDLTFSGNTWSKSGPIWDPLSWRSAIGDLPVDELGVTIAPGPVMLGATTLKAAARDGYLRGARFLLDIAYMATPGTVVGTINAFDGTIRDVVNGSTRIGLTVASLVAKLREQIPRRVTQTSCPYRFCDPMCGLSIASFTTTRTAATGSTTSVIRFSATLAADYYKLGSLTFNGEPRTIVSSADLGGGVHVVTLNSPLPAAPVAGNSLTLIRGCDRTVATCRDTFSNLAQYGGTPDAPNPESV